MSADGERANGATGASGPDDAENWYQVRFDDHTVYRAAQPPGGEAWHDTFAWDDVMRVCFEVEDFTGADGLYIFTRHRPESYAVPMFAEGAADLLQELIRRGLFDAQLALDAANAESGLFCWPETKDDHAA
jgi:hypothetical protein